MTMRNKFYSFLLAGLLAVTLVACGSDSGSDSGSNNNNGGSSTLSSSQEAAVSSFLLSIGQAFAVIGDDNSTLLAQTVIACESGEITLSADETTITFDNCINGGVTIDGSIVLSTDASGNETITWNNVTISDGTDTLTLSGSIKASSDGSTISFDNLSFGDGTDTFTMDGSITVNAAADEFDGSVTFTANSDSVTCTFVAFPVTGATQADVDDACGF